MQNCGLWSAYEKDSSVLHALYQEASLRTGQTEGGENCHYTLCVMGTKEWTENGTVYSQTIYPLQPANDPPQTRKLHLKEKFNKCQNKKKKQANKKPKENKTKTPICWAFKYPLFFPEAYIFLI